MKTISEIKRQLETLKPILKEKYQVENIGIFGSYTRGEQTRKSDIDILIEFSKDAQIGFFKFLELEEYLTKKTPNKRRPRNQKHTETRNERANTQGDHLRLKRNHKIYIQDILEAITRIDQYLKELT